MVAAKRCQGVKVMMREELIPFPLHKGTINPFQGRVSPFIALCEEAAI
jgi:hypothetical protein